MQKGQEACTSQICARVCSLEAQVLPVVSEKSTVVLGAGELLVDGLQDSAVQWVLIVQATLGDGQDQVPFFMETLMEFGRPEEAVPEGGEPGPSDGGLDPLLEGGEVSGLEMLQGLTEGHQLPRLAGAGWIPWLWQDAVHSLPFFLGSEDLRTHSIWVPSVGFACQCLEDAVVLQFTDGDPSESQKRFVVIIL